MVAMDKNHCIGKNDGLLFKQKTDLKKFSLLTIGNIVIMSHTIFELLGKKPLEGRMNYIITKNASKLSKIYFDIPNIQFFHTLQKCKYFIFEMFLNTKIKIYVIGGESIYNFFFQLANSLIITHIVAEMKESDCFIPNILEDFERVNFNEYHFLDKMDEFNYSFIEYKRKSK